MVRDDNNRQGKMGKATEFIGIRDLASLLQCIRHL